MSRYILIDFGASRVKYACFDAESGKFSGHGDLPAPRPARAEGLFWEESPKLLREIFLRACAKACSGQNAPEAVLLSSQMHGFVAVDGKCRPLSNYISWKDERSLAPIGKKESAYDTLGRRLGARYLAVTGMKMRPCFPAFNFAALARAAKLPRGCRLLSLPEWLCAGCDDDAGLVHETVFAGLGFYDLGKRRLSAAICDAVQDYCGVRPLFGCPVAELVPAASLKIRGRSVPLFTGVGDHQCAVLGAGNINGQTLSVNVGTGSQVSTPGMAGPRGAETRPYFDNAVLGTITHLPAGRALDEFLGLFGKSRQAGLWRRLGALTAEQVLESSLEVDLAVFASAYGYRGGGSVACIGPGRLTEQEYLGALVKAMAHNYACAAEILAGSRLKNAVFGGGVARKIPALSAAFERVSGIKARVFRDGEETLSGLAQLALRISGRPNGLEQNKGAGK